MSPVVIRITGASGQGIVSIGEILAKAAKRSGRCVFGYREYMSLIKGGHGSYQLDIADGPIRSSSVQVDLLITLNHHGFVHDLHSVRSGGIVLHNQEHWKFSAEQQALIAEKKLRIIEVPVRAILQAFGGKPILSNMVLSSFAWSVLGEESALLKEMVREKFAHKPQVLDFNMRSIDDGMRYREEHAADLTLPLPPSDPQWKDHLLLTGSQAMGLGLVRAGMRAFFSYPMTPASPLLTVIADLQNETGILVKQAEDEITAAQMMSGAMFMGTRSATATSGGGFDLMTETLSMNGIAENPALFILAQRPGPGTGLPTWTAQGDLHLALHSGHGEFARGIVAVSDAGDACTLMNDAFNVAENYQTPVIVLTDKHIAEGIFTQEPFGDSTPDIHRGKLVTDAATLATIQSTDRYDPTADGGVSARWLPGVQAAVYAGQTDEHRSDGSTDEGAANAKAQMDKRLRKQEAMKQALPEPILYEVSSDEVRVTSDDEPCNVLLIGWGSSKGAILDALMELDLNSKLETRNSKLAYLHYTWLWPLKTDRFERLAKRAKKIVLVEGNAQGQLGKLLRQETGIDITEKILKYDGRPFFRDELAEAIRVRL